MAALMGVKVAISYTVFTSILSIVIGFTLEKFGFEKQVKKVIVRGEVEIGSKRTLKEILSLTFQLMKTVYPFLLIGAGIGAVFHGSSNRVDCNVFRR